MANQGPSLLSALFNYVVAQADAVPVPVAQSLKGICAAGDILCEMTDGKRHLLPLLSTIINTAEETTGINRYYSGPVALCLVGALGANYIYRKYKPKSAFDLLLNIVKAEFGNSVIAIEIFNALKKSIEESIDKEVEQFTQKFATTSQGMAKDAKEAAKDKLTKALFDRLMPVLAQNLNANKEELKATAQAASSPIADLIGATVQLPAIPGAQCDAAPVRSFQAQAQAQLKDIVSAKIVNQSEVVQSLKAKAQ